MANFQDFDHALKTGILIGTLLKAGLNANMARDDEGNYMPFIDIVIQEEAEIEPTRVRIEIVP
jgi:hypothetical protein